MRTIIVSAFVALVLAFEPNKGPECKLTCRNRVPEERCPAFHYVRGEVKACAHSQYGCTDKDLNDCGEEVTRPPLCVVDGPCFAGPAGCLEDKTGADDGLPPGDYVGHCPEPNSVKQRCAKCRDNCAARYAPREFGTCLARGCRSQCPGRLLYETQYFDAKRRCETEEALADAVLQHCVKDLLNGTIPENYRCFMQYSDTENYCQKLGYQRGTNHFQGCIKKELDGVCSTEFL